MKKTFAAIVMALLAAGAFAGNVTENSVPAAVKSYIEKSYPRIGAVDWNYQEKENCYNARFKIDGNDYDLDISPDGRLLNSTTQIAADQLPANARTYIGKQFPTFKIKDARKLYRRGTVTYEADIDGQNSSQTLVFNENGALLDREL